MLRSLGCVAACLSQATSGAMPADHETIRIWGLAGGKTQDDFFLFREVLGGGGPGRPWADGSDVVHVVPNSRNLPAEFAETRYPILVEQLALKQDSGGAGFRRGGFGYDKTIKTLVDARLISNADRSALGCYGVNGGKAGLPYAVSVTSPLGESVNYPGMTDTVVVPPGASVRIVTTGGGGWGDPLLREIERVVYDVQCGLVSPDSALQIYGVVMSKSGRKWQADLGKTAQLRRQMAAQRGRVPMFDRGPHFESLKEQGKVKYPAGWTNPDEGWFANSALKQDVA
jgi:N-methylhydantoinase B